MTTQRVPKAQLLVILEPGREFRMTLEGATTSIGSDPDCKLAVSGVGVEARHCVIQRGETGFEVFDLFSSNGTLVNGSPVEAHGLRTGDQIQIGSIRIVFFDQGFATTATRREAPEPGLHPRPGGEVPRLSGDPWKAWQENPLRPVERGAQVALEALRESPAARSTAPVDSAPQPETEDRGWTKRWSAAVSAWRERRAGARLQKLAAEDAARQRAAHMVLAAHTWDLAETRRHRPPQAFSDLFMEQVRSSPFLVISLAFHVCILILLDFLDNPRREEVVPVRIAATLESYTVPDGILDDAVPPEIVQTDPAPDELPVPEEFDVPVEPDAADSSDLLPSSGNADGFPNEVFTSGLAAGGEGLSGLSGTGVKGGAPGFRNYVRSLRASGLDIVVVLDSTGSMGGVLSQAQQEIGRMIASLGALVPDFRLGVIAYRDHGDDYVTRELPLSPHHYQAVRFVDGVSAGGGGDQPEAVLDAMERAVRHMPWSRSAKKVVVIIADAPGHARDRQNLRGLLDGFRKQNGVVHALVTRSDLSDAAPHPDAVSDLAALARAGGGVSLPLDENAEVVRRIVEMAFGPEHRTELQSTMADLDGGFQSRIYSQMVADLDGERILGHLRRRPAPHLLFRELTRQNSRSLTPLYLAGLEDEKMPLSSRWVCQVLLERVVSKSRELLAAVQAMDPDAPALSRKRQVETVRELARRLGYPTRF